MNTNHVYNDTWLVRVRIHKFLLFWLLNVMHFLYKCTVVTMDRTPNARSLTVNLN